MFLYLKKKIERKEINNCPEVLIFSLKIKLFFRNLGIVKGQHKYSAILLSDTNFVLIWYKIGTSLEPLIWRHGPLERAYGPLHL